MSRIISKVFALQIYFYANLFEHESKLMVMVLLQDAIDHWIDQINVDENMVFMSYPNLMKTVICILIDQIIMYNS